MNEVFSDLLRHDAASGRRGLPCDPDADASSAVLHDLAHDLRQPLGIIETIAYYLELTGPGETVCVHLERIRAMVAEANKILDRTAESSC
jgi:hypothetical protein